MYHSCRLTAKVAGTDKGLVGVSRFSPTCFGAPFPAAPRRRNMPLLRDYIASTRSIAFGDSLDSPASTASDSRMPIRDTTALVTVRRSPAREDAPVPAPSK